MRSLFALNLNEAQKVNQKSLTFIQVVCLHISHAKVFQRSGVIFRSGILNERMQARENKNKNN